MNTGSFWTDEKEQLLWEEWENNEKEYPSLSDFAKDVAPKYGVSWHAIRAKIAELKDKPKPRQSESYEQGEDFINVICASERILSEDDIIKRFNVDLTKWALERFKIKTSEGYRKDRSVYWQVENGTVLHGDVKDSGKMLVVPLYHVEARFVKKVEEIKIRDIIEELKQDAIQYVPRYLRRNYPAPSDWRLMFEVCMPDIHFGRLTWGEETGHDYDIKIAEKCIFDALEKLLIHCKKYPVERILLPIGNDFFNVNSKANTTVRGTPQQEDTRWKKTFRAGRAVAIEMIEMCSEIAPVQVPIIVGNHDEEKVFYLGDALECWFHNNPNVSINNSPTARKYYLYGVNLIGFTHGSEESFKRLPMTMPIEVPELWAKSGYREFHCGDKHHKKDLLDVTADESGGIVVRILRSITPQDAWTDGKAFFGVRAAEAFLWDKEKGLSGQFTAMV